jgi:serine/threonine protein kinase
VLAALQHPHILPLIDFGREGDWLYLVTPLIPHGDLAERLARWGEPLPLDEVRRLMRQLTDALDTAHRAGIVHRDLKPANVLLDARGNCLLSDFGIAKLEGAMGLTAAGTTLGTARVHGARAGRRQGGGRALRHLRARRDPVRALHAPRAVRGGVPHGAAAETLHGAATTRRAGSTRSSRPSSST